MRIVSGVLKGRRIQAPTNFPVRPTTDFAKEGLFNILHHRVDFAALDVLDLFAGIGGISCEFASRGAKAVCAVDSNPKCADFIKKTAENLQIQNMHVLCADAFAYIAKTRQKFDLIFADPPYDLPTLNLLPTLIFEQNLLHPNGIFILEHSEKYDFSGFPHFWELRKYGKVRFSFFRTFVP